MFCVINSEYQQTLPTAGVELTKPAEPESTPSMFEDYVRARIFQNWKFWIVSLSTFFFFFWGGVVKYHDNGFHLLSRGHYCY